MKEVSDGGTGSSLISNALAFALCLLCIAVLLDNVGAVPFGADLNESAPETFDDNLSPRVVSAQAGNVTQIIINDTRVTRRWQGYYGNVTGHVVLSDSSNNSLYRWNVVPNGEVYAANFSTIDWGAVKCVNFSSNLSDGWSFNISTLESFFGAGNADVDGIDETFNDTYLNTSGFMVASSLINNQGRCPLTYTYIGGAYQASEFEEVLLTDNSSIIFTALLEKGQLGFNGKRFDFQMLVAENGDDPAPTSYYFYVEVS